MKFGAKANLYVLQPSEGGRVLALYSGLNARLRAGEVETDVVLDVLDCERLAGGESGTTGLTLLRPEALQSPLYVGQAFELSVHGVRAAVGQILSVSDRDIRGHTVPECRTTYSTDTDQSRFRDVDKSEHGKNSGVSESNRFVKSFLTGGFIGFLCAGPYFGRYPVIAPVVVVLMGCANLFVDDLLGRFESTTAETESNSSDPDTT